jgi:hypothetical protein
MYSRVSIQIEFYYPVLLAHVSKMCNGQQMFSNVGLKAHNLHMNLDFIYSSHYFPDTRVEN